MSNHIVRDRALEAKRVAEAYAVAATRAENNLHQARLTGDPLEIRIHERLALEAIEQLLAAQDYEDRCLGLWRAVRPGGGHQ